LLNRNSRFFSLQTYRSSRRVEKYIYFGQGFFDEFVRGAGRTTIGGFLWEKGANGSSFNGTFTCSKGLIESPKNQSDIYQQAT